MIGFLLKLCSAKLFPVSWTILTIFLLCIPGSAIPGDGFFGFEGFDHMDKLVHALLFGCMVCFWGLYLYNRQQQTPPGRKAILLIVSFTIILGVVLEYVQLYFIPYRSFDMYDIVADAGAAIIAGLFFIYWGVKTKSRRAIG